MSAKQMTQVWASASVLTGSEPTPAKGRQAGIPWENTTLRESSCVHVPMFPFHPLAAILAAW